MAMRRSSKYYGYCEQPTQGVGIKVWYIDCSLKMEVKPVNFQKEEKENARK